MMSGRTVVSFGAVESCISSLRNCQFYISTGMDVATKVALDLVQNHNDAEEVNEMENVMLEYAAMNRELNHYVEAVTGIVNKIKQDKPDTLPDLKNVVEEKFEALASRNNNLDLQRNVKFVIFKDQLKQMKAQVHRQSHSDDIPALEQVDEDIAVTESQMNFICPITQEEMKKPVKNKICGHAYEEVAILELIQHKEQRKKVARCPRVGCNNLHVKKSDLVPDEVLKRAISSQNKQSQSTR